MTDRSARVYLAGVQPGRGVQLQKAGAGRRCRMRNYTRIPDEQPEDWRDIFTVA